MSEAWIAFEYDHDLGEWVPSDDNRHVYHQVGHIRAALKSQQWHSWEIKSESPGMIECEHAYYVSNPTLPRNEWGGNSYERHVASGRSLVFVEMTAKLNGTKFPDPPELAVPHQNPRGFTYD